MLFQSNSTYSQSLTHQQVRIKMIIFEIRKFFQFFFGEKIFGGSRARRIAYIILPIFISISKPLLLVSLSLNFALNIGHDIPKAWPSVSAGLGFLTTILLYWHLLINRSRFYSLFDEMQDIVDERKCQIQPISSVIYSFYFTLQGRI